MANKLQGRGHGYIEILLRLSSGLTERPYLSVKLNQHVLQFQTMQLY